MPPISCVTLGKFVNLSVTQSLIGQVGMIIVLSGLSWRLTELLLSVQDIRQFLAQDRRSDTEGAGKMYTQLKKGKNC